MGDSEAEESIDAGFSFPSSVSRFLVPRLVFSFPGSCLGMPVQGSAFGFTPPGGRASQKSIPRQSRGTRKPRNEKNSLLAPSQLQKEFQKEPSSKGLVVLQTKSAPTAPSSPQLEPPDDSRLTFPLITAAFEYGAKTTAGF